MGLGIVRKQNKGQKRMVEVTEEESSLHSYL